jgi:hypothetical protein
MEYISTNWKFPKSILCPRSFLALESARSLARRISIVRLRAGGAEMSKRMPGQIRPKSKDCSNFPFLSCFVSSAELLCSLSSAAIPLHLICFVAGSGRRSVAYQPREAVAHVAVRVAGGVFDSVCPRPSIGGSGAEKRIWSGCCGDRWRRWRRIDGAFPFFSPLSCSSLRVSSG